jgi:hypothetical protein
MRFGVGVAVPGLMGMWGKAFAAIRNQPSP